MRSILSNGREHYDKSASREYCDDARPQNHNTAIHCWQGYAKHNSYAGKLNSPSLARNWAQLLPASLTVEPLQSRSCRILAVTLSELLGRKQFNQTVVSLKYS